MDQPPASYRREFFKSPHHAGLGLATLGAGFILGATVPLALLVAPAAYLLGWVYLPDMRFFRRWVDGRREASTQAAGALEAAEFVRRRDGLLAALTSTRRQRYHGLAAVCRDIESATVDDQLALAESAGDPRLRKLDELMWTFLRMLTVEESLDRFLEIERRDEVPDLLSQVEEEARGVSEEIASLKKSGQDKGGLEAKERLLASLGERLDVLRKRLQRIEQSQNNLQLIVSEEDRLEQQIKLIRADAMARRNAEGLTARIDATVEHLNQTNKWLVEMDEFKDLAGDLPANTARLGYEASRPPPLHYPDKDVKVPRPGVRLNDRK